MPEIVIDGDRIECREGITVLQAALDAGVDVPHYCYHPGLSVVASCRLCMMEMKLPNPRTRELDWAPKLFPSCQSYVKDGLEVRFASDKVKDNRQHVMEFLLLNHPLDCPVCDQAGECWLQDYSYRYGNATSRFVDQKDKNPKKDIGPNVLLYADRCIMCTRCVRFCNEISGMGELAVINRGSRTEIDVFPGIPLDNPLSGNVVDICPVGALLDKQFLFKQRVWFLESTPSVCAGCSTGCSIQIDHNDGKIYRLRPRYNPDVNQWWICDEGRYGWQYVQGENRLTSPSVLRGSDREVLQWEDVLHVLSVRLDSAIQRVGSQKVLVALSPFMTCEEGWMLAGAIRQLAPMACLALNTVPTQGQDQTLAKGFCIRAEKCPNRRGIELILQHFGAPQITTEELTAQICEGLFDLIWLVGGYRQKWYNGDLLKAVTDQKKQPELLIVQDIFQSELTEAATIALPAAAWAEKDGSFMNSQGIVQPFEWAVRPPEGVRRDGQLLWELSGRVGLYSAEAIRQEMAAEVAGFEIKVPVAEPVHQH